MRTSTLREIARQDELRTDATIQRLEFQRTLRMAQRLIPEKCASLASQEQPTLDDIATALNTAFTSIATAFTLIAETLAPVMARYVENVTAALEDAQRENAYHPTGPVVSGTATPLYEDRICSPH